MSVSVIKHQFEQKYPLIDCTQFPKCPPIPKDPDFQLPKLFSMRSRAQELNAMVLELKDAKENATTPKVIGCLKVAFLVAVLAGAVLGGMFIPVAPVAATVVVILGAIYMFSATALFYDTTGLKFGGDDYGIPVIACVASLVLPIVEAFTRVYRLEKRLEQRAAPIQEGMKRDEVVCQDQAAQYKLLKVECERLQAKLDDHIAKEKQLLGHQEKCIEIRADLGYLAVKADEKIQDRILFLQKEREAVERVLSEFVNPRLEQF